MIPQADPKKRFDEARTEIRAAIERVFDHGKFILGEEIAAFECEFASYLGLKHVVGLASGTDALCLALIALGIERSDEVVTVSLSAPATAVAIEDAGATPVFVDVDPKTRCMDPALLAAAIGPRTAAIVPVHLHGFPAQMDEIMRIAERHGLKVVEDCAQAHGAKIGNRRVGSFGHAAAFSFYPTKNLGAPGDAGAVATNDMAVDDRIRRMRTYGWNDARICVGPGSNHRLDEIHAAVLRVLLPKLDRQNTERRQLAAQYRSKLKDHSIILPPEDEGAVYHQFAVMVDRRDDVRSQMLAFGVGTGIHYPLGLHRHPRFLKPGLSLPVTDELCKKLVSLPIQPEIARDHTDKICQALLESVRARAG